MDSLEKLKDLISNVKSFNLQPNNSVSDKKQTDNDNSFLNSFKNISDENDLFLSSNNKNEIDFNSDEVDLLIENFEKTLEEVNEPKQSEKLILNGENTDINGQIEGSRQGMTGDCWLLSSINALSYTEKGRQIIKDAIEDNGDGTYTVSFSGVDTSITVTDEELENIRKKQQEDGNYPYSKGDDDVLLMEIATEKVMDLIKDGEVDAPLFLKLAASDGETSITGGWLTDLMYLLEGYDAYISVDEFSIDCRLNDIGSHPDKYAAIMWLYSNEDGTNAVVKDVDGNDVSLISEHAWSIKSVDEDNVTIVNPWDSTKEYKISKSELKQHISAINYYDVSYYKDKKECSKNFQYDENGNRIERTAKRDEDGKFAKDEKKFDKDGNEVY